MSRSGRTTRPRLRSVSRRREAQQGVAETEAVVDPSPAVERVTPAPSDAVAGTAARVEPPLASKSQTTKRDSQRWRRASLPLWCSRRAVAQPAIAPEPAPAVEYSAGPLESRPLQRRRCPASVSTTVLEPAIPEAPPAPAKPEFVEVVVPASSVVGLNVVTSITSETARVEDRVEARVTRDVLAEGRVAIPAGTRVIGDVTLVERGGKMKDKARLGVRFHTLVLADGNQIPFRTDAIFREGASPGQRERSQDRRRRDRRRDPRGDHRRRQGRRDRRRHGRRGWQCRRDGGRSQRRDAAGRNGRHGSTVVSRLHRRRARAVSPTLSLGTLNRTAATYTAADPPRSLPAHSGFSIGPSSGDRVNCFSR